MTEQTRFTLAQKSLSFMKGLATFSPLLEIAKDGLSRDLPAAQHIAYARRICASGNVNIASQALSAGVKNERAECMLAAAIDDADVAFGLLINRLLRSESAEAVLAKRLVSTDSAFSCYVLLKLQTIRSHEAQEILAHSLHETGMSDRAVELLLSSSLDSEAAQGKMAQIVPVDPKTITKIIISGSVGSHAASVLSERMPPVCVPLE